MLVGRSRLRSGEAGEEEWKAGDLEAQRRRSPDVTAQPRREEVGMMQEGVAEGHERSLEKP